MEDVDIPTPNPFITQWLVDAECRQLMWEVATIAQALYREASTEHIRTGLLVGSARIETAINRDRWNSYLLVEAPYAPSEEFGAGDHPGSTHRHHQAAAHTLNTVLDLMSTL